MSQGTAEVWWDENVPIKSGTFSPDVGTETLDSCTVTLYDKDLAIAGTPPVSAVAATSMISTADAAPYAWFDFHGEGLALDEPNASDYYTLTFLAVDSNGHEYSSTVRIKLNRRGI